jgi:hypothetical protein
MSCVNLQRYITTFMYTYVFLKKLELIENQSVV